MILSGSAGVGKSHLVKTIYQAVSKLLQYHDTSSEKPRVLILAPTGVASINVNGTTIHSALNLPCRGKLYPLDANTLETLRNRFPEMKLITIDEISMVSKKVLYQINQCLIEIFKLPDQPFAGKSILAVEDLYQLPPVNAKPAYAYTFDFTQTMGYLSTDLWRLFKLVELTQVMCQKDKDFIEMLNKIRKGLVDESSEKMLRSRFVDRSNSNYLKYGLHVFAENAPVSSHNVELLNELSDNEIEIHSIDTIPTNGKMPHCQITATQNQSLSKTGGLAKILKLKIVQK